MSADISQPLVIAYRIIIGGPTYCSLLCMHARANAPFPACQLALINVGYMTQFGWSMEGRTQKERRQEGRGVRKQLTLG